MDPTTVTASGLARLFGIRDDEPNLHLSIESDINALAELDIAIQSANDEVLAEFFALHLPSLLNLLQNLPAHSSLGGMVLDVLPSGLCFRLPQVNVGLQRCPAARDLPRLLVKRFTKYPLDQLDDVDVALRPSGSINLGLFLPWTDAGVLFELISPAVQFGPASVCNFNLDPSLLDDFGRVARHFLSTPFLERERMSATTEGTYSPGLKFLLESVLALLGRPSDLFEADEDVKFQHEESLRCGWGQLKEHHLCEVGLRKGGVCEADPKASMLCSECRCVAYCSREHQKLDWKKHKPVCFKPSW